MLLSLLFSVVSFVLIRFVVELCVVFIGAAVVVFYCYVYIVSVVARIIRVAVRCVVVDAYAARSVIADINVFVIVVIVGMLMFVVKLFTMLMTLRVSVLSS